MVWELFTSGQMLDMAGVNVSMAGGQEGRTSGQRMETYSQRAQDFINAETRQDWVSNRASSEFSGAVSSAMASKAAIDAINFDMSGYTSRSEAQTMLDVNNDIVRRGIAFLQKKEHQKKMGSLS